ncbi:MAG: methyltransferase domain-containing protein, partial [Leptospirales bacterium]
MAQRSLKGESRTIEQLREHYDIERELAAKLHNASQQERTNLYTALYNEMYKRVPLHPQLIRKLSSKETEQVVAEQMKFIKPFLDKDIAFLEVGPGDCALSFEIAKVVRQAYAADVSDEITKSLTQPPNFQLILFDGIHFPLPTNSINLAYSNQLMEHLHPDDAFEQLENIYNKLILGGVYICITPNRLNGPHDISKYFDDVATGFHLKEYTTRELISLFRRVGFSRIRVYVGGKGKYMRFPATPIILYESFLDMLPHILRKRIVRFFTFRLFLG